MKRLLELAILVALALSLPALATNHYILPSPGTGTHAGTDWNNACSGFSGNCSGSSMVRGDTYFVGSGSYSSLTTLSTADSGTSVITILGATVANHGTATGWSSTYSVSTADGGSAAIFSNTINPTTDYWVFDGAVPSNMSMTLSDYGFEFPSNVENLVLLGVNGTGTSNNGPPITGLTFRHIGSTVTTADDEKQAFRGQPYGGPNSNIYIGYSYFNYWQGLVMALGQQSGTYDSWIVEHNIFLNGFSSASNHGEWIDPDWRDITNMIIRYNYFSGNSNTGGGEGSTGSIVGNNAALVGAMIYGNVFYNTLTGDGVITDTTPNGAGDLINSTVINNTFAGNTIADCTILQANNANSTGNVAYNNLFYGILTFCSGNGFSIGGFTHDYSYIVGTYGSSPSETHLQTGTSNPFVSSSGSTFTGWELTSDTRAGLAVTNWSTLPAGCTVGVNCYNVDANGVVRGANGTIDRGAFQISGGPNPPPTGLTVTVH